MSAQSLSQFNLIDALKYGAIGISFVCLLLAFWSNQTLFQRASSLKTPMFDQLVAHSKWTMKFSFACLIAAIAIETIDHFSAPITLRVGIVPSNLESDAKQIRSQISTPQPLYARIGADDDIPFKNGTTGQIRVAPNSTIFIYVEGMWDAVKELDNIAYGQQQHCAAKTGGTLEPRQ